MSNGQARDRTAAKPGAEEPQIGQGGGNHRFKMEFKLPAETLASMIDIQKQNADLTAERVRSLLNAVVAYGRGLHDIQLAYVDMGVRSVELLQRATRDLATCGSPTDAALLQQQVVREGMDQMLVGVTKILETSSKAADQVSQPIHDHLKSVVNVDFAAKHAAAPAS